MNIIHQIYNQKQGGKNIKYIINKKTGCHECISHFVCNGGYPLATMGYKNMKMHRKIYIMKFGPIKPGLVVRHKCDNKICINIKHLELGTNKQNSQDMVKRGRSARGERSFQSKLNNSKIKFIRKNKHKYTLMELGKKFNVHYSAIGYVVNRKTWRHVL